jgi:hypothetical protein
MADLHAGDRLVFHFSGHGSQLKDPTRMEKDGFDETSACAPLAPPPRPRSTTAATPAAAEHSGLTPAALPAARTDLAPLWLRRHRPAAAPPPTWVLDLL